MNCSDYDDGSPKRYSWGNASYADTFGISYKGPVSTTNHNPVPAARDRYDRGQITWQEFDDIRSRYFRQNP